MKTNGMRFATVATVLVLSAGAMFGQVPASNAGLSYMGVIPIPNWTATGATQEATDLSSFNPVTQVLYYADRVNHAVDAIDTRTNSFLGLVPVPSCVGSCPSGVLVVPDLQKLVVTDRATTVYIYDLNLPGSQPVAVTVPSAIDELDYDPIHQRVYIGNTSAPYFLTGIDLADGSVVKRFPQVTTDDVMVFNSANRRWYSGSGSNANDGGNCPSTNAGNVFPIVGVFQAAGTLTAPTATLVGTQCSGRNGSNLALDPIHGNIYIPVRPWPADPAANDSGVPGILIFNDPAPTQATPAHSQAVLGSFGTVDFTVQGRAMNVTASFPRGIPDANTVLVITTTIGNEVVACGQANGRADCAGTLIGDPLIGGMALLGKWGTGLP